MLSMIKNIIVNSIKYKQPKTTLGRWSSVTKPQQQKRAEMASVDHCGTCSSDYIKNKEWTFYKEIPTDTCNIECAICKSTLHETKECPEL